MTILFLKMDFKSPKSELKLSQNSNCKVNIQSDTLAIDLGDKSELLGKINSEQVKLNLYKNADATLEGNTNNFTTTLVGSTKLSASKFFSNYLKINQELKSSATVNVLKEIKVYLKDNSKIYIYGTPEVIVEGIRDYAQIHKLKQK